MCVCTLYSMVTRATSVVWLVWHCSRNAKVVGSNSTRVICLWFFFTELGYRWVYSANTHLCVWVKTIFLKSFLPNMYAMMSLQMTAVVESKNQINPSNMLCTIRLDCVTTISRAMCVQPNYRQVNQRDLSWEGLTKLREKKRKKKSYFCC